MGKHRHPGPERLELSGVIQQLNFSPKGGIEGALLGTDRGVVQVNFPPHFAADGLIPGQAAAFFVEPDPHAEKHAPGDHAVYHLAPEGDEDDPAQVRVEGVVRRFNYARHGEPNGVVLDSGDFVHLKPDGMRRAGLGVGQSVTATGSARPTVTGHLVVEAVEVNGVALKKPHH